VVLDDADLDKTVAAAVKSRFDNSGQTCIAAKRFIVVEAVADEFTRRFVQAAGERQYGDPDEPYHAGADGPRRPARRTAQAGAGQRAKGARC
jgi:acyl-CoA reductase-like NAD-dependent aldehyde dehydrogenase